MEHFSSFKLKRQELWWCNELAMEYNAGLNFLHCPTLLGSMEHVICMVCH